MRLIEAALAAPDVSGVVISGAAGVGKSRVAREAVDSLASRGYECHWAVGTSSARSLPLGAFAPWATVASDTLQLVRGVIEALTATTHRRTVVVCVDDVQWLDDLSTYVLHQIVQRRRAKILVTVRDGEPVPSEVQDIWKVQFDRLDLMPLSRSETAELLASALGAPIDPEAASRLWALTSGNVLYLRNIVDQEVSRDRLVEQNGHWRWIGEPVVPPGLVELIESRIGALPDAVGEVVDTLAVGEPLDLDSLSRITDRTAVEEAEIRGLVTLEKIDETMQVRIAHPLYGEVRRERAPATRLRRLRGFVAAELAARDDSDDMQVVVRRAALSLDSDLKPEPALLIKASFGAVWRTDFRLADRLADAAIRTNGGADARLIRAFILSSASRGDEAETLLAEASPGEFSDVDFARLAFMRALNSLFARADPHGAKEIIDQASSKATPRSRSFINAFHTVYWAAMGRPEIAMEFSKKFAWEQLTDVIAARVTAWALALAAGETGKPDQAAAAAEAGYKVPLRWYVIIADAHLNAMHLAGRIEEAQKPADVLRQVVADFPTHQSDLIATSLAGRAALTIGRLDTACSELESAVKLWFASGENRGWRYRFQISYTIALAMRGQAGEAAVALEELERNRHPAWRSIEYEHTIAKAWVAASQGSISQAVATALAAARTARDNGQFAPEVMALQTAVQFGDHSSASRLEELKSIVGGPRVCGAARFAQALCDRNGAELASVSMEFERTGDHIAAIDAAAHAAIAYRRSNMRGSALACSEKVRALCEACAAETPASREAIEPSPLTTREREIVMMMGGGLRIARSPMN